MEALEYAKDVATTILAQLGGSNFLAITGAKASFSLDEKEQPILRCKLPGDLETKNKIDLFLVTYDIGMDLYNLSFMSNSWLVKKIDQAYAEDLISHFEEHTGLYTSL